MRKSAKRLLIKRGQLVKIVKQRLRTFSKEFPLSRGQLTLLWNECTFYGLLLVRNFKDTESGSPVRKIVCSNKDVSLMNVVLKNLFKNPRLYNLCKTKNERIGFMIDKIKIHNFRHIYVKWLGEKWGLVFYLYELHVPYFPAILLRFIAYYAFRSNYTEAVFISYLKHISTVALKLLNSNSATFLYLINLEVLGGYDTVLNRVNVIEMQRSKVECVPSNAYKLDIRLKEAINYYVFQIKLKTPARFQTLNEFVAFRDNWNVGASCTHGSPVEVCDVRDGKKYRLKSKLHKLSVYSDCELISLMKEKRDAVISTFIKSDEPAKTRNIQNFDVMSFLRCSYFESFIDSYISNRTNALGYWTSIGLSPSDLAMLIRTYAHTLKQPDCVAISIDQSEFDMHQSLDACLYVIYALYVHILSHLDSKKYYFDLTSLYEAEKYAFEHLKVCDSKSSYPWRFGLPSGHKFTALIGTVLNAALNKIICEDLNLICLASVYQGDDAVLLVRPGLYSQNLDNILSLLVNRYKYYGLLLNSSKCLISYSNFEYLKHYVFRGNSFGVPARAMKSLLWYKPLSTVQDSPYNIKFNNVLSLYRTAYRRRLRNLYNELYHFVYLRVSKRIALSKYELKDKITQYLNTPLVLSGAGFGFAGRMALYIDCTTKVRLTNIFKVSTYNIHPTNHNIYFLNILIQRSLDSLPRLPTVISLRFERVNLSSAVSVRINRSLFRSSTKPLEIQWVSDLYKGRKYYYKKLELEYRLFNRLDVYGHMVPDVRLSALPPSRISKIIRTYNTYADRLITFENASFNILTYTPRSSNLQRVWVSTLTAILILNCTVSLHEVIKYFRVCVVKMLRENTIHQVLKHYS